MAEMATAGIWIHSANAVPEAGRGNRPCSIRRGAADGDGGVTRDGPVFYRDVPQPTVDMDSIAGDATGGAKGEAHEVHGHVTDRNGDRVSRRGGEAEIRGQVIAAALRDVERKRGDRSAWFDLGK